MTEYRCCFTVFIYYTSMCLCISIFLTLFQILIFFPFDVLQMNIVYRHCIELSRIILLTIDVNLYQIVCKEAGVLLQQAIYNQIHS